MRKLIALCALVVAFAAGLTPAHAAPAAGGMPVYKATATVSDATPAQYRYVTVTGRLLAGGAAIPGAQMRLTWHYRTYTVTCTATTDKTGRASCIHGIGRATIGYPVRVDVVFLKNGKVLASTATRFVPRQSGKG